MDFVIKEHGQVTEIRWSLTSLALKSVKKSDLGCVNAAKWLSNEFLMHRDE